MERELTSYKDYEFMLYLSAHSEGLYALLWHSLFVICRDGVCAPFFLDRLYLEGQCMTWEVMVKLHAC